MSIGGLTVEGSGTVIFTHSIIFGGSEDVDYRCRKCDVRLHGKGRIEFGTLECKEHGPLYDAIGLKKDYGYMV